MIKSKVYVAGHKGMVGSAIVRNLSVRDDVEIITADRNELDLLDTNGVNDFFRKNKIDQFILQQQSWGYYC